MPEDWRQLARPIAFEEMQTFLAAVDGKGGVTVSIAGEGTRGRPVYLVHVGRGGAAPAARRVLFYAQQHGDEVAGKDALLYLIRDLARDPSRLPAEAELWILPLMNPDGAVAGTRESGAGVDLNRDHIGIEQPETRALHMSLKITYSGGNLTPDTRSGRFGSDTSMISKPWPCPSAAALSRALE